jgi:hypothetical protein
LMRRDWDPSIKLRTCATEPTSGIPIHLLPDPGMSDRVFDTNMAGTLR